MTKTVRSLSARLRRLEEYRRPTMFSEEFIDEKGFRWVRWGRLLSDGRLGRHLVLPAEELTMDQWRERFAPKSAHRETGIDASMNATTPATVERSEAAPARPHLRI
jgi:hypothetical protein